MEWRLRPPGGYRQELRRIRDVWRARWERLWERVVLVLTSPIRIARRALEVVGAATVILLGTVGYGAHLFMESLPNVQGLSWESAKSQARMRVAERLEDKQIKTTWTPIQEVSRDFLYAIVMSEDSEYFEHDGINVEAIIDAIAVNLRTQKNAVGASTISQQVAKNLFLDFEKSYVRKIKEFIITRDLERRFTKNQLLELYLNLAEFGPDVFGVEAASRHYFGKKPQSVNAAEGAFIALMLPSPRKLHYSVFQNQNLTDARRKRIRRVLQDMLYNEFITEAQFVQYVHYSYFKKDAGRAVATSSDPHSSIEEEQRGKRSSSSRSRRKRSAHAADAAAESSSSAASSSSASGQ